MNIVNGSNAYYINDKNEYESELPPLVNNSIGFLFSLFRFCFVFWGGEMCVCGGGGGRGGGGVNGFARHDSAFSFQVCCSIYIPGDGGALYLIDFIW